MSDSNQNNKSSSIDSRPTLRPEFQGSFKDRHKAQENKRLESRSFEVTELDAPVDKTRLTHEELDQIDDQRREQGKKLAKEIYELTNNERESRLEVYVRTINDVVLSLSSEANQAILDTACDYFESHFGPTLKQKGHSPQMIDAIVHRTGRQTRAVIERVIKGFDVEEIAQTIWEHAISYDPKTETKALAYMKELTNHQVRELREVYNTIPARILARLLHDAIHRTNIEGKSYPNIDLIRYVLLGRTPHEVEQIKFQFDEHFHHVRFGEGEQCLMEQVEAVIPHEHLDEVKALLQGFQVNYFVEKIVKMLGSCAHIGEPPPSQTLNPDFAGKFRRSYSDAPHFIQELRARDAINDLLSFCTPQQFNEVSEALQSVHGASLTSHLYTCNNRLSAREVALYLHKGLAAVTPRRKCNRDEDYLSDELLNEVKDDFRLSTNKEIKDVVRIHAEEVKARECAFKLRQGLSALRYLDPHDLFEVDLCFHSLFNQSLREYVEQEVDRISLGDIQKYSQSYIDLMLAGTGRLGLKADLFNLFQSRERRLAGKIEEQERQRVREQAIDTVEKINRFLKRNQSAMDRANAIVACLRDFDTYALNVLEQVYLELSDQEQPLRDAVKEALPELEYRLVDAIFNGVNLLELAESLSDSPENLFRLSLKDDWYIQVLESLLPEVTTQEFLHHKFSDDLASKCIASSVLAYPKARMIKELFTTSDTLDDEKVGEFLAVLRKFSGEMVTVEAAYNRLFSRFSYCFESMHGTLLQRLRVMGSMGLIPRPAFAEAILLLEEIEPSISAELSALLSSDDISVEDLSKVETILIENKPNLQTIKKSYNAIDEERTLREAIYSLRLPLRIKNRLILALDGYNPIGVAEELHDLISSFSGHELGEKLHVVLASPSKETRNERIPLNPNWTDEMYNQVRLTYFARYGTRLVTALRQKEVPVKGLGVNLACFRLYGEVSKRVVDLRKLLKAIKSASKAEQLVKLESTLLKMLEKTTPALRERLFDMYLAYFGPLDRSSTIQEVLNGLLSSDEANEHLNDLVLEAEFWDEPEDEEEAVEDTVEGLGDLLEQLEAVA